MRRRKVGGRLPEMDSQSSAIPKQSESHLKIAKNAEEIARLHRQVHDTFRHRDDNETARQKWKHACAEFHARYNALAFPDGLDEEAFFDHLRGNDPVITEWALCFLEVRPYFFGSGYVWRKLSRRMKYVTLSPDQDRRFSEVLKRYEEWKAQKRIPVAQT
jgi:hypothetical protein